MSKTDILNIIMWIIIFSCFGLFYMAGKIHSNKENDYHINLVNINKAEIKSNISGNTYKCHPDSILYYLEKDNL